MTRQSEKPGVLSVTQLSYLIRDLFELHFSELWVSGEISNLSRPQSGHYYFTLKDENAQIRGVIWRSTAERLKFEPEDGMQLVCAGNLDVYPPRGSYQLVVRFAEPLGQGPLQIAFKKLHEKLKLEGLFAADRKQPIPRIPKKIAVITSPTGAAVRDFLQVMNRRWGLGDILVIPSRVQGDEATSDIIRAIRTATQVRPIPDLVVITRGGGSLEDLWCFNEEKVVRAVAECPIPVISAIGHEIDITLTDLAADKRALTPSEAAEMAVPSQTEIRRSIQSMKGTFNHLLFAKLDRAIERLNRLASRPVFRKPLESIRRKQLALDELQLRGSRAIQQSLQTRKNFVLALARQLESISPLAVLNRGYSLTQNMSDERLVDSINLLKTGDLIQTLVKDGSIVSRVESTTESELNSVGNE